MTRFQRNNRSNSNNTYSLWLMVALLLLTNSHHYCIYGQEVVAPTCGDCWCILDEDLTECPNPTPGITGSFSVDDEIYSTFELTNADAEFLKLQTSDGSSTCFPFVESVGAQNRYPLSTAPACVKPTSTDTTVCAYLYEPDTACAGRKYQVLTYDSSEAAVEAGAAIVHKGACGVCSSAQDFAVVIKHIDTLQDEALLCSTSYTLNPQTDLRFGNLQTCFRELGFSESCSTLWSHFSASNVALCTEDCFPDPVTGRVVLNGPPPTCPLEKCLTCSLDFQEDMSDIAGFTMQGAGIREEIAKPCSVFLRVTHDPCVGASSTPAPMPTSAPGPNTPAMSGSTAEFPTKTVIRSLILLGSTTVLALWLA